MFGLVTKVTISPTKAGVKAQMCPRSADLWRGGYVPF
jgi:hypothetical protein